jgi:sarcosine oxidase subunit beta
VKRNQTRTDCIVVGAGIVGCSIALWLARKGHRPLVVERENECGMGSTRAASGIVHEGDPETAAALVAAEGRRLWQSWPELLDVEDPLGLARFREVGVLWLTNSDALDREASLRRRMTLGTAAELLDREKLSVRYPDLRVTEDESDLAGILEPESGYVDDPALAAHNLRLAAEAAGARFLFGTKATDITWRFTAGSGVARELTGVVTSSGAALAAPVVVNAAGPSSWQVGLLAQAPLALATAPVRVPFLEGTAPAVGRSAAPLPVLMDLTGGIVCKPDPFRFRLEGLGERDRFDFHVDPDRPDPVVPAALRKRMLAALAARVPTMKLHSPRPLVGVRDVTVADGQPLLDRTKVEGYFVAIGLGELGFRAAPALGWLAAELVDAVNSGYDHDARPLVVRLPASGNLFDLGAFSRLSSWSRRRTA